MELRPLAIDGVFEIIPTVLKDDRGHFFETYHQEKLLKQGIDCRFPQDNQSFSYKGVVRGLHMQAPPFAQAKLVRVVVGKVLDVVVDCRLNSPTYGQHLSLVLSAELNNSIFIPEGFAHGFSALEDTILHYKCSNIFHKESERGINPLDSTLNIDWGISGQPIILSEKDRLLPDFLNFRSPF